MAESNEEKSGDEPKKRPSLGETLKRAEILGIKNKIKKLEDKIKTADEKIAELNKKAEEKEGFEQLGLRAELITSYKQIADLCDECRELYIRLKELEGASEDVTNEPADKLESDASLYRQEAKKQQAHLEEEGAHDEIESQLEEAEKKVNTAQCNAVKQHEHAIPLLEKRMEESDNENVDGACEFMIDRSRALIDEIQDRNDVAFGSNAEEEPLGGDDPSDALDGRMVRDAALIEAYDKKIAILLVKEYATSTPREKRLVAAEIDGLEWEMRRMEEDHKEFYEGRIRKCNRENDEADTAEEAVEIMEKKKKYEERLAEIIPRRKARVELFVKYGKELSYK